MTNNTAQAFFAFGLAASEMLAANPDILKIDGLESQIDAMGFDGKEAIEKTEALLSGFGVHLSIADVAAIIVVNLINGDNLEATMADLRAGLRSGLVYDRRTAEVWARLGVNYRRA